jgi:hypothetical protein
VSEALTAPFATAALVLCVAGIGKLRSHASGGWVALALVELGVGAWCVLAPGRVAAAALASTYALLAIGALVLARRREACGCFGDHEAPASIAQSVLSATLALVALAAVISTPHGITWVLQRSALTATTLILGTAAAAYGAVLAYTQFPRAWGSWSPR